MKRYTPVRKVSSKQRARLKALSAIRERWWALGLRTCGICKRFIMWRTDYTLDHITPGKMGRGTKDDSEANLQPAHWICNSEKGSRRSA